MNHMFKNIVLNIKKKV